MNERQAEYQRYLQSPEWINLRGIVMKRSFGMCELCHSKMAHVHHVRYPKIFKDDHPDNLLAVCEVCHDKIHGIRSKERMNHEIMIFNREGLSVRSCIGDDGNPWFYAIDLVKIAYAADDRFLPSNIKAQLGKLDSDEKTTIIVNEKTHQTKYDLVSEIGAYGILMGGNTQHSISFCKWLRKEVIPSIMRTGKYEVNKLTKNETKTTDLIRAQTKLVESLCDEVDRVENKIDQLKIETSEQFKEYERKTNSLFKEANKISLIAFEGKTTVRARLQQHGIPYDKQIAAQIGLACRKKMNSLGDFSCTKTFDPIDGNNVNVWLVELIDDVCVEFGILKDDYQ